MLVENLKPQKAASSDPFIEISLAIWQIPYWHFISNIEFFLTSYLAPLTQSMQETCGEALGDIQ